MGGDVSIGASSELFTFPNNTPPPKKRKRSEAVSLQQQLENGTTGKKNRTQVPVTEQFLVTLKKDLCNRLKDLAARSFDCTRH
jgi:hypothetical protein